MFFWWTRSQKLIHNSIKTWYFDEIKRSWKFIISFYYFQKIELHFGCGSCWPSFCPNRVLEEQFITTLPVFFQNYNIITQVNYINSMSQHISLEISKKNPQWVELKGTIWPGFTINKASLTWPASPWENWMVNIKNFHGVIQSNNMFFCRLRAREILTGVFNYFFSVNGSNFTFNI